MKVPADFEKRLAASITCRTMKVQPDNRWLRILVCSRDEVSFWPSFQLHDNFAAISRANNLGRALV
jgi:hypothetical protein